MILMSSWEVVLMWVCSWNLETSTNIHAYLLTHNILILALPRLALKMEEEQGLFGFTSSAGSASF